MNARSRLRSAVSCLSFLFVCQQTKFVYTVGCFKAMENSTPCSTNNQLDQMPPDELECEESIFFCPECDKKTPVDKLTTRREFIYERANQLKHDSTVCLLQCKHCLKDTAVLHKDFWVPINEFLHKPGAKDGVKQVTTDLERVFLYILSQVCHNQYDLDLDNVKNTKESPFKCHSHGELAWLFWVDGQAVGFSTVKDKGLPLFDGPYNCEVYQLPMVDTIYIRHDMRGRGLGTLMVRHYLAQYPGQNVGFSSPASVGLLRVLHKILLTEKSLRDLLWECSYDGSEGYRRNVWFHTKYFFKQKQKKKTGSRPTPHDLLKIH